MTECRPPDETPDGTVCWLRQRTAAGRHRTWEAWTWDTGYWQRFGDSDWWTPQQVANQCFSFHSIATPPEDAK